MKMIKEIVERALAHSSCLLAQAGHIADGELKFGVEHPNDESHGDYSSNIAMAIFSKFQIPNSKFQIKYKSPRELAEEIVEQLNHLTIKPALPAGRPLDHWVEKIEVAGAGFINFYLKKEFLWKEARLSSAQGGPAGSYGRNERLKGKKIMVEYTDPNPFKEFHIGHLMSNTIGESLARILEANGAEVKRACYQGDVGLHVAKSIWGMQELMVEKKLSFDDLQGQTLQDRQKFMGQAYAYGAGKYESDEVAKAEMHVLNKEIYDELADPARTVLAGVMEMYHAGRAWSLEYFETIYKRLGTKFDEYFFESEAGSVGLTVVQEGLDKEVLEIGEEGAVIYKGEKDGLHTRVFRNKLGLPTYEAKDLGLAKTKWERYKYDLSYIVTANEIDEYFKVVLKVMEQLYPDLRAKTRHLSHGMMKLTSGKMSSRTGKVVTGEGLLNELREVVMAKMGDPTSPKATQGQGREIKDKDQVADKIAVGSLKYMVLKQDVGGDIIYEPEKMTNLEGNTGSYIQYTYVRAFSVLNKFQIPNSKLQTNSKFQITNLQTEEIGLLRWIYRYPEVVEEAGKSMKPSVIATYINELASRFNSFYNKHQIVGSEGRVMITKAVASVISSGLGLLGIEAPEEM